MLKFVTIIKSYVLSYSKLEIDRSLCEQLWLYRNFHRVFMIKIWSQGGDENLSNKKLLKCFPD